MFINACGGTKGYKQTEQQLLTKIFFRLPPSTLNFIHQVFDQDFDTNAHQDNSTD
jgi:hypothetical protein